MDPLFAQINERMGTAVSIASTQVGNDVNQLDNAFRAALKMPYNRQYLAQQVKIEGIIEDLNFFHELFNKPQSVDGDPFEYRAILQRQMNEAYLKYKTILVESLPKKKVEPAVPPAAAQFAPAIFTSDDGTTFISHMNGVVNLAGAAVPGSNRVVNIQHNVVRGNSFVHTGPGDLTVTTHRYGAMPDPSQTPFVANFLNAIHTQPGMAASAPQAQVKPEGGKFNRTLGIGEGVSVPAFTNEGTINGNISSIITVEQYCGNFNITARESAQVHFKNYCHSSTVSVGSGGMITLGTFCHHIQITLGMGARVDVGSNCHDLDIFTNVGSTYEIPPGCKNVRVNGTQVC